MSVPASPRRLHVRRAAIVTPLLAVVFIVGCLPFAGFAVSFGDMLLAFAPYGLTLVVVGAVGALRASDLRIAAAVVLALSANAAAALVLGIVGTLREDLTADPGAASPLFGLWFFIAMYVFFVAIVPSVIVGALWVLGERAVTARRARNASV